MGKHFSTYYYQDAQFGRAFLNNLREGDVRLGGSIQKGDIVKGACGIHVAEAAIEGFSAVQVIPFRPNRNCDWNGLVLRCMALENLPVGRIPRSGPKSIRHRHCVLAELDNDTAVKTAETLCLPIVRGSHVNPLINLEVASVARQLPSRRATLL